MLENKDIAILIEEISVLSANYIHNHIKEMSSPNFDNDIFNSINELLLIQMPFLITEKNKDNLKDVVRFVLDNYCYIYIIPKRFHYVTKPRELTDTARQIIKDQITYLTNVKQPEQEPMNGMHFVEIILQQVMLGNVWEVNHKEIV